LRRYALGKATAVIIAEFTLHAQPVPSFSSSGANHISTVWCPHSCPKSRGSFSLAASASQCPLHIFLLLPDFHKKSQSLILPLYRQKNIFLDVVVSCQLSVEKGKGC
jgi:hypothetical protein